MLRHPAGILGLVLAMLGLATVAGGVAEGTWGLEHVRGATIIPALFVAGLIIFIAGDRRGPVALVAEMVAVVCALWALNHIRLLVKWYGDGFAFEQTLSVLQAIGLLAATALLIRARPTATEDDWHRGSAILGAGLWLVGLRTGPGSRAGLAMAGLLFVATLSISGFEKVRRAPAVNRALERMLGPADQPVVTWPAMSGEQTTTPDATRDPEADEARTTDDENEHGDDAAPQTEQWTLPAAERTLPAARPAPTQRTSSGRIQTRIRPKQDLRWGPWSGVLSDRATRRPWAPSRPSPLVSPAAPVRPNDATSADRTPEPPSVAPPAPPAPAMDEPVASSSLESAAPAVGRHATASVPPGPLNWIEMGPRLDPAASDPVAASAAESIEPPTMVTDAAPSDTTLPEAFPAIPADADAPVATTSPRPASVSWTDPQVLLAADLGAASVTPPSPLATSGTAALVAILLGAAVPRLTAGRESAAGPATPTTGTA